MTAKADQINAERLALKAALSPQELKWHNNLDYMMGITFIIVIGAAVAFTMAVTMGDWEYWVDWKDRRYWPLIPPALMIIFPAAVAGILWRGWRLPIGATFVVFGYTVSRWAGVYLNFDVFAGYPLSFAWPSVFIPMALVLDCALIMTRSVLLTALGGGGLFGAMIYAVNWPLLAPYHEPVNYFGEMLTLADLYGFEYIRTGMPEYLRIIERSVLRSFGEAVTPLTAIFAAFLCMVLYLVGWAGGQLLSRPIWLRKV